MCIPRIYHLRSRSEEVCSFNNCKLPLTSISGGILVEYTYKLIKLPMTKIKGGEYTV